jgi:MFS family permease
VLKTLLVMTNSAIASKYSVSYTAAAALTAVPFGAAAVSSLASGVLSQAIGKRAIHLGAVILMAAGVVWNMNLTGSYLQFMLARTLQGVGWGAFEGIVAISVRDIFSVRPFPSFIADDELTKSKTHELSLCFNIISITSTFFTWGSPILGGYLYQTSSSFHSQLLVTVIIQACALFMALFFFPETSTKYPIVGPRSTTPPFAPSYFSTLRLLPYTAPFNREALQPIRAIAAPSALLSFIVSGPITAAAFGLAATLALIFTPAPASLLPSRLGLLFILPAAISLIVCIIAAILLSLSKMPPPSYRLFVPGTLVGLGGLLSFGLYTSMHLKPDTTVSTALFALNPSGLSLTLVSLLLAFLTAGTAVLGLAMRAHLLPPPSPWAGVEAGVGVKGDGDVERAGRIWMDLLCGAFIIGIPAFANSRQGAGTASWLKEAVIAIAIMEAAACVIAGLVGWVTGSKVRRVDRKVLGMKNDSDGVDLEGGGRVKSYFDAS